MRFVVVNGPPASGKSTLAELLARRLALPLLSKDVIKEALGDALDVGGQEWTKALSDASFEVLWAVAGQCPTAVLEGNFYAGSAARLASLDANPLEIFCRCPVELCRERYATRAAAGRHEVHPQTTPPATFFEQFGAPMSVGPVLEVSTDQPTDIDSIIVWIAANR